jgi:hypothetical protein
MSKAIPLCDEIVPLLKIPLMSGIQNAGLRHEERSSQ